MRTYSTRSNFYFVLLFLFSSYLFADSGKISGNIRSAKTGEAIHGVNVIVEELSLGAATDIDGHYVILNIPSGNYTLFISAIGYTDVHVKDVRVNLGQTSRQDIELQPEVIKGKEITVTAKHPMIRADLTATQHITTSEEMKDLPVESFIGVLSTQAGVNTGADGFLHIRGGRTNEVGYYIDGVSVSNPFNTNGFAVNVSNKALEEMKVVSGAFNAEYGNAMSGIVNIQIKEGGSTYKGNLSVFSGDYLSSATTIFPNIDNFNLAANRVIEGAINGPIPLFQNKRRFTFNVSGRYSNNGGYLYGIREHEPSDHADFRNPDYYYVELGGDGAYVSLNHSEKLNLLTKLTLRVTPKFKISAQLLNDNRNWKQYSHPYKYNPDGTCTYYQNNNNYSLKFNQLFQKSFYTLNLFYSTTDYHYYVYPNPTDSRYVSTANVQGSPPSTTFDFGGTQMGHLSQISHSTGMKLDYTNQINSKHEIQTGFDVRSDNLEQDSYTILYNSQEYVVPTVLPANDSPSHSYYNKNVLFTAGYIQDKMEYDNLIVNIGTRIDYYDPKADYIADLLRPETSRKKATPKTSVSPRLGISFPITDQGILHFSYGHFYQLPTLKRLYQTAIFGANQTPSVGYANLKPEKTVLYEFGLQQQLTPILAMDGSIFYKDIRDLLALQSIHYDSPTYGPSNYSIYLNKDYASIKGITLSITKRWDPATKTSVNLDYSYQVTQGNAVSSGSFYFNALTGQEKEKEVVPLAWDQSHVLTGTLTFSDPSNWALSFIGNLATGWPYTPQIVYANYNPKEYSDRKPMQKKVDTRFSKFFTIGSLKFSAVVKIYNLFDTRNERYVFDDTGRAGYTYATRSSQELPEYVAHYGEAGIHTWSEYQIRPQYYSAPRSFQIGCAVDF